jgi:hypothetical protein
LAKQIGEAAPEIERRMSQEWPATSRARHGCIGVPSGGFDAKWVSPLSRMPKNHKDGKVEIG